MTVKTKMCETCLLMTSSFMVFMGASFRREPLKGKCRSALVSMPDLHGGLAPHPEAIDFGAVAGHLKRRCDYCSTLYC